MVTRLCRRTHLKTVTAVCLAVDDVEHLFIQLFALQKNTRGHAVFTLGAWSSKTDQQTAGTKQWVH